MAFLTTLLQLVLLVPTAAIGLVLHLLTSLLDRACSDSCPARAAA